MANPLIKICGIRNPELVQPIAQAGADFIGIIFHPTSKRHVDLDQAKLIAIAATQANIKPVAVFVNQTAEEMRTICEKCHIHYVQLHGEISRSQHHLLPANYHRIYVQVVKPTGKMAIDNEHGLRYCKLERDFLLFDSEKSGDGIKFDWQKFQYDNSFRWFLAGGLSPSNVNTAVKLLQPSAVDVSSGVENKSGEKDIELIKKFIVAVRTVT